jgi:plasmid stabilization system protein ParE
VLNYKLSRLAEEDIRGIRDYTQERCGNFQAEMYLNGLEQRIIEVADQVQALSQSRSDLKN